MTKTISNPQLLIPFLLVLIMSSCQGLKTSPDSTKRSTDTGRLIESGVASWYGPGFQGKKTANGEIFDTNKFTAAHRTLPFGTTLMVVHQSTGKKVKVRVNDRGPYAKGRIIDLSRAAATKLDMLRSGTASVKLYLINTPDGNLALNDIKKPGYTVQIASYEKKDQALAHVNRLKGAWLKTAKVDNRPVYRVYYGKYDSAESAGLGKKQLAGKGINGFVKQVEN